MGRYLYCHEAVLQTEEKSLDLVATNMDDPLIGLTIYDTTKSCDCVVSAVDGKGEPVQSGSDGAKVPKIDDTGEDCFPCLPSMPDDQYKPKMRAQERSGDIIRDRKKAASSDAHEQVITELDQPVTPIKHEIAQPKHFWLMRLFQSNLFDMSIAIGYLFNSKDPNVQSYLGSRLFVSTL